LAVGHERQTLVTQGMTAAEVEAALGRPARRVHRGHAPEPIWLDDMTGGGGPMAAFDADFGADGKVASAAGRERAFR
jgi:hypothetical protein